MLDLPFIAHALTDTQTTWGSSRFGEWRRCQTGHHLKYHLGLSPAARTARDPDWEGDDASYFEVGRLVHACLAFERQKVARLVPDALRGLGKAEAPWRAVLEAFAAGGSWGPKGDAEVAWEAERLVDGYFRTYGDENAGYGEGWEVLGVEVPLSVEAGVLGPLPYTARADALLKAPWGELVIDDTKTRGRAIPGCAAKTPDPAETAKYARGLRTRPQFAGLSWLVQRTFNAPGAVPIMVNAIVKTKAPRYTRVHVEMTDRDLEWWAAAQTQVSHQLQAMQAEPEWWRAPADPSQCAPEVGSRCWAFLWCHGTEAEREKYFVTKDAKEKSQ